MIWGMIFAFILLTILFAVFAIFFPEWVGITGPTARKNMESHQSNKVEGSDSIDSFLEGDKK